MYFESWIFGVRNQTIDESSARLDGGVFDLKIAKIKIVVEEAVEQNSSFLKIPENFEWVAALSPLLSGDRKWGSCSNNFSYKKMSSSNTKILKD